MQSAPKELLKEYVRSQQLTNTADIMQAMKEMFRDVLEQVMEVDMDDELGRECCQRSGETKNYRNGYTKFSAMPQNCSCILLFLPPYSPELNPVENSGLG